jgi:hypothetical protein
VLPSGDPHQGLRAIGALDLEGEELAIGDIQEHSDDDRRQ